VTRLTPAPAWERTADMAARRTNVTGVALPDGTVLVVGGQRNGKWAADPDPVFETEIYHPDTAVDAIRGRCGRSSPERLQSHVSMPIADREVFIERLTRLVKARPEVVFALLHGSFASGGAFRDIDIAVWVDRTLVDQRDDTRYVLDLGAALTVELGVAVDVQILNDAPVEFRHHALAGIPLLSRDPELFADVRERTWDEYFDFLPFARQYLRDVLSA
jgi:predicted nucleotidyltransferase